MSAQALEVDSRFIGRLLVDTSQSQRINEIEHRKGTDVKGQVVGAGRRYGTVRLELPRGYRGCVLTTRSSTVKVSGAHMGF